MLTWNFKTNNVPTAQHVKKKVHDSSTVVIGPAYKYHICDFFLVKIINMPFYLLLFADILCFFTKVI